MTAFNLYGPSVNSFDLDPLQGQDAEVFFIDNSSGLPAFFGHLQSFTFSVRDSTETYLTLGTRHPTYLSGEIQIAWVAEQAMVDTAMLARAMGQGEVGRHTYAGKSPKFTIGLDFYAQDLVSPNTAGSFGSNTPLGDPFKTENDLNIYTSNEQDYSNLITSRTNTNFGPNGKPGERQAEGRIEFLNCKIDSISSGIMPGKRTIAQRLEGVAEGFRYVKDQTLQEYKDTARSIARQLLVDATGNV